MEDEPLIALDEERTLTDAGYVVLKAHTGEMAIEMVCDSTRPEPIDLILMDINLGPGIDGTDAAREILKTHKIPILFLSGHTEPEIVEKTDNITSYGYVVKGSGSVVLLAAIKMALRLRHSEQRFQSVLSHVREVAVQGYAADGTTNYWNAASELVYGYSAEEAIGRKLWDLIIPPEMVAEVKESVFRMLTTERPHPPETLSLLHKDGSRVRVRSSHSVTRNAAGVPELFCLDVPLDVLTAE
ncbi:MAG: response regulator [Spirochaetaceae bacterium]